MRRSKSHHSITRRGRLKQTFYQFDSGRIGRTPVPTVNRTACDQANLVHC
jgi:hypothetical protein